MRLRTLVFLLIILFIFCADARAATSYSFGVRISGKGRPMIMIPGLKGSADTYNEVVEHYKNHYKCYVITLAGYAGQPPSDAKDHLLLRQRDEIISYIINEHLHKPVLVGFSFGGELALWITCTRPDLIGSLIDIDGTAFDAGLQNNHFNKDSLIKADSAKYARIQKITPASWRKRDSAFHSPASNKLGFQELKKMISDSARIMQVLAWDVASDIRSAVLMDTEADTIDMRETVARVRAPILVLGSWTTWDYKNKAEGEADYRNSYAKGNNVFIVFSEKGRHFLMWEDFDWMIGQMDAFLKKNDGK
jgi:N-formylmaleamate deformylase